MSENRQLRNHYFNPSEFSDPRMPFHLSFNLAELNQLFDIRRQSSPPRKRPFELVGFYFLHHVISDSLNARGVENRTNPEFFKLNLVAWCLPLVVKMKATFALKRRPDHQEFRNEGAVTHDPAQELRKKCKIREICRPS